MGDSDSEGLDADEVNEAYEEAKAGLEGGTLACLNSDGTYYRCPFSPGRKKQDYRYSDIRQHGVGVGKGNRGPVAVGRHRALVAYLDSKEMAERAQPQAERRLFLQQDVPSRVDCEDRRVYPWMGVLQNIDNHTRRSDDGFRTGAGPADIKEKLKAFHPESVKVLYDVRGHQGVAVVEFRNTVDGFKDAEAFGNSFYVKKRGRRNFENDSPSRRGTHLYGWVATKKDVEGGNKLLSDHLKACGDLKSLPDIVRELEGIADQQVQNLKKVVIINEGVLQLAAQENWGLTNKIYYVTAQREQAEQENQKLVEVHKKELEAQEQIARCVAEDHERNMRVCRSLFESRIQELKIKSSSEIDSLKLETERLLAWYTEQVKHQEAQEIKHIELINKHKEEKIMLENQIQDDRRKLHEKQQRELETQRVAEQLETELAKKAEIVEANKQETDNEKLEEYVKSIAELRAKQEEMEEERLEEQEAASDMMNTLTISQRKANDEIEDARTIIMDSNMLDDYGTKEIGVKCLGELNTEGWYELCKDKFKSPQAFQRWVSELDGELRTHDFRPLRMIPDGKAGNMTYAVDVDDPRITELRNKYGPVVADAVGAAALEIEIWNPSGRYIIRTPWDFLANKRASMSQIFGHMAKILKGKEEQVQELLNALKKAYEPKRKRGR